MCGHETGFWVASNDNKLGALYYIYLIDTKEKQSINILYNIRSLSHNVAVFKPNIITMAVILHFSCTLGGLICHNVLILNRHKILKFVLNDWR